MSPLQIHVLLHYYARTDVYPEHSNSVEEAVTIFLKEEILTLREEACRHVDIKSLYRTTDRGKALVTLLCHIEFPTSCWLDHGGNKIDI